MPDPVRLQELARRLGHSPAWLYRRGRLALLYAEGMPRPMTMTGRREWDRLSIEAWLGRHHPHAIAAPANDQAGPPMPANDRAWRLYLDKAYPAPAAGHGPGKGNP
jgi:predicted DNA-binding transcriptional regulator AlpA